MKAMSEINVVMSLGVGYKESRDLLGHTANPVGNFPDGDVPNW